MTHTPPPKKPEEHDMTAAKKELMPDLKPCPWDDKHKVADFTRNNGQEKIVYCDDGDCPIHGVEMSVTTWNTRAEPPCDDASELGNIIASMKSPPVTPRMLELVRRLEQIRPAPISVEVLEGMKQRVMGDTDAAAMSYNAALDAIIAKLKGE
jgi:hypothetical protein